MKMQKLSDHQACLLPKPDTVKVYQLYTYIYAMASALLAFTILVLHACHSVLCNDR